MLDHTPSAQIFDTIFHGLDADTLYKLYHVAIEKNYEPGVVLCHQGQIEQTFYVVVEGVVEVVQTLEDGQKRPLGICGPSQFFGEMSLLDKTPRIADCITREPTTVLEITQEIFHDLVDNSPAVAYTLMYRFLENLRANNTLAINELLLKNQQLAQAYEELQVAQLELVKKERLEHELEIAAEVQRSLLPQQLPEITDYEFAAYLQFARRAGGNFYDVMVLDDEYIGLLLGDVADKGVHASLFMAVTRTLFLSESKRSLSPVTVTRNVQRGMLDVSATNDMFVMAFYGVLHRPTGQLTYVLAGHQQPVIARADGSIETLEGHGSFLGMFEAIELHEYHTVLHHQDRLVVFSNGVTDAMNQDGRQYGRSQLIKCIRARLGDAPQAVVDHITDDITNWCAEATLTDNLALLVVAAQ